MASDGLERNLPILIEIIDAPLAIAFFDIPILNHLFFGDDLVFEEFASRISHLY
jgi:hypothetical protein